MNGLGSPRLWQAKESKTVISEFAMEAKSIPVKDQLKAYARAVQQRDEKKKEAETYEMKRKAAWREYYALNKVIDNMNEIYGINDVLQDGADFNIPSAPDAPKKTMVKKRKLTDAQKDAKSLKFDD